MIAVSFEVEPRDGLAPRFFELAAALRPALEATDGFISGEHSESLTYSGHYLSLNFWRDEDAVRHRCYRGHHRRTQQVCRCTAFAS